MRNGEKQGNLFPRLIAIRPKAFPLGTTPNTVTSSNSDSSLLNHPREATSHSKNNISVIGNTSLQSTQNQNSIILSFNNKAKVDADIIWSLFSVRHGFSDSSMTNFVSTLSRMFPGVDKVKNLALVKDSIRCYMNYGIYPYFRALLKIEVNKSPFIVTCFDESLNKKTQNCELDLQVRYWDVNNKRVQGFEQVILWDILSI